MPLLDFQWTAEARYRARLNFLLFGARTLASLGGRQQPDFVSLSWGYQQIVERTCTGYSPAQRDQCYPLALEFIQGRALLAVVEAISPAQMGHSLFLHREVIEWIDHEGCEFEISTVFACVDAQLLVATSQEFRLGEAFLIDRQLLRAEVVRVREQAATSRDRNRKIEGES